MKSKVKTKSLWRVSLVTSPEAEDAAGEVMQEILGSQPAAYYDCESRLVTLSVYFNNPSEWTVRNREQLGKRVAELEAFDLRTAPARLRFQKVPREDWAESWKRHFKPLKIGKRLLVRPSWIRLPKKFEHEIVLDPGLSFGTGQHPTTEFCLRQLASPRLARAGGGLLDMGTGTGILAIAAAKLGFAPVEAFDFDSEAVEVATSNAQKNCVAKKICFAQRDLTKLPKNSRRKFEIVCANLTANLLISELERILARLKPGGYLILAGILASEFGAIKVACEKRNLRLVKDRIHKEWRSAMFFSAPDLRAST